MLFSQGMGCSDGDDLVNSAVTCKKCRARRPKSGSECGSKKLAGGGDSKDVHLAG